MLLQAWKASPRKYSEDSRDFQLMEHLYDLAFNNSKTAIDAFDPVSRTSIDRKLLDLACKTLGFDNKGNYDASVLQSLVQTFKHLVRNKGQRSTIEEAVRLLLNSQHITKDYLLIIANHNLELFLPTETKNAALLDELFKYILPVGYTSTIKLQDVNTVNYYDYLTVKDKASYRMATDIELSELDYIKKLNGLLVDSEGQPLVDAEGNPILDSEGVAIASDRNLEAAPSVNIETVLTGQKE